LLKDRQFDFVHTRDWDRTTNLFRGNRVEVDEFPRGGLTFPDNVGFYFDHMYQLGLAGIYQEGNQEPLLDESRQQIGVRVRSKYRLTDLGHRFARACIKDA
jgi:hypothetical protein